MDDAPVRNTNFDGQVCYICEKPIRGEGIIQGQYVFHERCWIRMQREHLNLGLAELSQQFIEKNKKHLFTDRSLSYEDFNEGSFKIISKLIRQRNQSRKLVRQYCTALIGKVQTPTGEWACSQCGQVEGHIETCIAGIMEGWEEENEDNP